MNYPDPKEVGAFSPLSGKKWIRNVKIVEIPYYNRDEDETSRVEFQYYLSDKKQLGEKLKTNKLFFITILVCK